MTVATNRRPKTAIVPKNAVDEARAFLQELPDKPKENLSLREAVNRLQDQLKAALVRGYSYDDLAAMLSDRGIEISPSTLKNYVPSGKRQAAKESADAGKPRGRRSKKQAEDPSEAAATTSLEEALSTADISPAEPTEDTSDEAPQASVNGSSAPEVSAPPARRRGRPPAVAKSAAPRATRGRKKAE